MAQQRLICTCPGALAAPAAGGEPAAAAAWRPGSSTQGCSHSRPPAGRNLSTGGGRCCSCPAARSSSWGQASNTPVSGERNRRHGVMKQAHQYNAPRELLSAVKRSHRLRASWPARRMPTRQLTRRRQSKKASSSSWSSHPPGAPPPLPRLTGDSGPSAGGLPPSSPLLLPLLLGRVLPLAARLRLGWKSHSRVCPGPTCKERQAGQPCTLTTT